MGLRRRPPDRRHGRRCGGRRGTGRLSAVGLPGTGALAGGGLTLPNPDGLRAFTPLVTSAAIASAGRYDRVSEAVDLRASDRAWWAAVQALWHTGRPAKGAEDQVVDGAEALGRSGYAVIVRASCGNALVARSLQVTIGPRHTRCAACRSQLFFVNRRGHALLYYVY